MSTEKLTISFLNSKIEIKGNVSDNEIFSLWEKTRDDYLDWAESVRLKKFDQGVDIISEFKWNNMSTWWINKLVEKDSFINNLWLKQIMIFNLCRTYAEQVNFTTDNFGVYQALLNNNIKLAKLNYRKNIYLLLKLKFSGIKKYFLSFLGNLLKSLILPNSYKKNNPKYNPAWFFTVFPFNWHLKNDMYIDRNYNLTPVMDKNYGDHSAYVAIFSGSFIKLLSTRINFKRITNISTRDIYFAESNLTFKNIFSVFWGSILEKAKFEKHTKSNEFKSLFEINGQDLSSILIPLWRESYQGFQQNGLLQALALEEHFRHFSPNALFVNYCEFFAINKATFFLLKNSHPLLKNISIQHAVNSKNKIFGYHRRGEFNYSEIEYGRKFSPFPDFFLTQGSQSENILLDFYEKKRINTIGSLKLPSKIIQNKDLASKLNQLVENNKRVILFAPSIGKDFEFLLSSMINLKQDDDWLVLVSKHPGLSKTEIKSFIDKNLSHLKIKIINNLKTNELLPITEVIVTSYSSLCIEAKRYNLHSVNIMPINAPPQLDKDKRVIYIHNPYDFPAWFENFKKDKPWQSTGKKKEKINDYFFAEANSAANNLWCFLRKLRNIS